MSASLAALLSRFLTHLAAAGFAASTRQGYNLHLRRFLADLAEREIHRGADVTPKVLVTYQNNLITRGSHTDGPLALSTQVGRLCQVRQFFRFLVKHGYLLADPSVILETPRVPRRLPARVLTLAEMKRLLAAPDVKTGLGLRDRAILELMYATGVRVGELAALAAADIDHVAGELLVRRGKGGRARLVPVGAAACLWVSRYLNDARPQLARRRGVSAMFLSWRGRCLRPADVLMMLGRYAKAARIPGRVTPHTMRHTFATHLLKGKASLRHIQELLGHAKLTTTQIYTRVDLTDLKEVYRRCHPRGRE